MGQKSSLDETQSRHFEGCQTLVRKLHEAGLKSANIFNLAWAEVAVEWEELKAWLEEHPDITLIFAPDNYDPDEARGTINNLSHRFNDLMVGVDQLELKGEEKSIKGDSLYFKLYAPITYKDLTSIIEVHPDSGELILESYFKLWWD